MQRLSVVGSVLYVAAHPDDENTSLLTYLASGRGVRAAYLSMTRGDGGQNLIGAEQGIGLGIIRTQELLAARRIDGAEQMFTRARDFGYSKSVDEALRIWGEDEVLADVVLAIRRVRPDVIITRFSGQPAAATATTPPRPGWRSRRSRRPPTRSTSPRVSRSCRPGRPGACCVNRGGGAGGRAAGAELDVGGYDPLLGAVLRRDRPPTAAACTRARASGSARRRGPHPGGLPAARRGTRRAPRRTRAAARSTGSTGAGAGCRAANASGKLAAEAARHFRPDDPAASIPALLALDAALDGAGAIRSGGTLKRAEVARLVAACAGLWVEAERRRRPRWSRASRWG